MKHTTFYAAVALFLLGALGCGDDGGVSSPGGSVAGGPGGRSDTPGTGGVPGTGGAPGTGERTGTGGAGGALAIPDASPRPDADATGAQQPDQGSGPAGADASADLPLGQDLSGPTPDLQPGADGAAVPPAPYACSALAPLAVKGLLTERSANGILFAKDRSVVVLQVKALDDPAAGNDVLLVRLPEGEVTPIGSRVWDVEWLAEGSSVLIETVDGDLLAVSLVDGTRKVLASGSCDHTLSPDGRRLFSAGGCTAARSGTPNKLDLVDTTSGAITHLGDMALIGGYRKRVVVSPNSEFAALLAGGAADSGEPDRVVHLLDRSGRRYAIVSQPGASDVAFVSSELLVFAKGRYSVGTAGAFELRGHVPGSDDQSYLVASGFDYLGNTNRYHFSRDGKLALAARSNPTSKSPGIQLAAIALDGSGARVLAEDMLDIFNTQMAIEAYAFAGGDRHAVYLVDDPNTTSALVATVPLAGGPARTLGHGTFASSPVDDRLALADNSASDAWIRVADVGTKQDICQVAGATVHSPGFLPDGRGLVFKEYTTTGSWRLHYVSLPGCNKVELARLSDDRDPDAAIPPALGASAVDPTSCFAVVTSIARSSAGTSVVLLPR